MRHRQSFFTFLFLVITITACNKEKPGGSTTNDQEPASGNGMLKGVIYSPNGKVPLASVVVETTVNGTKKADTSDKNGKFLLELPAGEYNVKMFTGAGDRLSSQKTFSVEAGKTKEVPAAQTALSFSGKIAYIKGAFDSIQTLITEMGIPAKELSLEDAQDFNKLKQYDVLLLNCNSEFFDYGNERILERFLEEGRSIYASDWEIEKLSAQDFGFIPKNLLSYDYAGVEEITEGNILFEPFKKALGKSKISIDFNLSGYVRITQLTRNDDRFKVLVDHPQKGPLAVSIQWAPTHLSPLGIPTGGKIIYTTFHDAKLSADVKLVLQQMILQL